MTTMGNDQPQPTETPATWPDDVTKRLDGIVLNTVDWWADDPAGCGAAILDHLASPEGAPVLAEVLRRADHEDFHTAPGIPNLRSGYWHHAAWQNMAATAARCERIAARAQRLAQRLRAAEVVRRADTEAGRWPATPCSCGRSHQ